jgi:hypothetical protein
MAIESNVQGSERMMKDHGIVGEASPVSEVKIERFTRPAKLKG